MKNYHQKTKSFSAGLCLHFVSSSQMCLLTASCTMCLISLVLSPLEMNASKIGDQNERFLLISTLDGVYRLGLDGQSSIENWDVLNVSAPEVIAQNPINGEVFWVEQDIGKGSAQIYRRDAVTGHKSLALEVKFDESRPGPQVIQAMVVDWATRNVYFAIQHERRFRVCDDDSHLCTEILGNDVSESVCDMELLPQIRKLFWVDINVEGRSMVRLNTAWMDGKDAKVLASYEYASLTICPCMTIDRANLSIYMTFQAPSGAYRVDTFDLNGNKYRSAYLKTRKYLPSHIYISGDDLIWVGRPSRSTGASSNETDVILKSRLEHDERVFVYKDYAFWNLPRVTGLTLYGYSPNRVNTYLRKRMRESHPCRGIRLLSKAGSLRCACPLGTRWTADELSCKTPEHSIIYGTEQDHMFLNNASGAYPISLNSSVFTFAYAAKENQLLWTSSNGSFYGRVFSVTDSASVVNVEEVVQNTALFTAKQIEYDWTGDNIFALDGEGNIRACRRTSGACSVVVTLSELLYGVVRFALDPKRGYLYWIIEGGEAIYRTEMDGTGNIATREFRFVIHAMTVDQSDGLLYFASKGSSYRLGQSHGVPGNTIAYCHFASDSHKYLIRLSDMPEELKVTNGYVFWASWSASENTWSILSCEKGSGNGLELHASKGMAPRGRVVHFDVIIQNLERSNVCGGGLCSHICIPTVAGYMRCACPIGFRLRSDGWTCERVNEDHCTAAQNQQTEDEKIFLSSKLVKNLHEECGQGEFQCLSSKECIKTNETCDGHGDCKDYSDEDPRCNDICETNRCSGTCSTSPVGPICSCSKNQELADDLTSCTSKNGTPEPGTETQVGAFAAAFGTLAAILAVICLVVTWKFFQTKRKLRDMTEEEIREFIEGDSSAASLAPNGMDRAMMLPYKSILSPDGIAVGEKVLGSGEYGVVHSGIFNGQAVAIKMLKHRVDVEEFKAVLAEMKIMSYLGDHENIIKFFGSDVSQIAVRQMTIVTELSPYGDLLHYLWKVGSEGLKVQQNSFQQQSAEHSEVSVHTLNQWCEQIASGMEYLVSKQVIHGDLAARNVLVFDSNVVKIADFGMSKQLYGSGHYKMKKQKKLPWKWGSIELLTFGEFSEASDVWAFGVTAWEIFSLGETPYKKIMQFDTQFIQYLREGNRLTQPTHGSRSTFALLLECWNAEAASRPDFALLREFFHEQVHNMNQREEKGMSSTTEGYSCVLPLEGLKQ